MKENTLVAVFDRAGSECAKRYHFVIGKKDDAMAGGIYISKSRKEGNRWPTRRM
jgi:hypothetical protein